MAEQREVIRGRQPARPCADDEHALARRGPRLEPASPSASARSPRKRSTAWMLTAESSSVRLQLDSHGW